MRSFTPGGAVFLIAGSWPLGALETVLHAGIDHLKCEERLSFADRPFKRAVYVRERTFREVPQATMPHLRLPVWWLHHVQQREE